MDDQGSRNPLRCDCKARPIIAFYGRNNKGHLYIHVAAFRNHEPIVQVYTTDPISICCKECKRWWNINIKNENLTATERMAHPPIEAIRPKPRVLLDNTRPDP